MSIPGRFISIFFQRHGLSPFQIGVVLAVPGLLALPTTPFICHLADKSGSRERILIVTHFISLLCFLFNALALPCLHILPAKARFPVIAFATAISGIFSQPAYPIVSAISLSQLRYLHGDDAGVWFGKERLWAAAGWAIGGLFLGATLDYTPFGISVVYLYSTIMSLIFILTIIRFQQTNSETGGTNLFSEGLIDESNHVPFSQAEWAHLSSNPSERTPTPSIIEILRPVIFDGGLVTIFFFHLSFWLAVGMSIVENLLFLYFHNELHASNLLCGFTVVITVIFEIPLFAYAPVLLKNIGAPILMVIGALAYVVRAFGYAIVPSAWCVLFLEPLHGITYAAVESASVAYVSQRTTARYEATAQALLTITTEIGFGVGIAIGGFIIEHYGSRILYRVSGSLVLIATFSFVFTTCITYWRTHHSFTRN